MLFFLEFHLLLALFESEAGSVSEVTYGRPRALATPWEWCKRSRFSQKTGFQSNNSQFRDIPCLTMDSVFISPVWQFLPRGSHSNVYKANVITWEQQGCLSFARIAPTPPYEHQDAISLYQCCILLSGTKPFPLKKNHLCYFFIFLIINCNATIY